MLLQALKEDLRRATRRRRRTKIKFDTHIRNKHEITPDGRVAYEEFRMYVFMHMIIIMF